MYKLTNHLSKVLLTITDKKILVTATPNDAIIDYFTAYVFTANNYYPGGMLMPGRKYQASATSNYRYSINGQEKSDELNENLTTALYWEYDSRIGRRWNGDPKPNTAISPYATFENNPIFNTDPLGDSIPRINASLSQFKYSQNGTVGGAVGDFFKIFPNITSNIGNGIIGAVNMVSYNVNQFDKLGLGGYIDAVGKGASNDISSAVSSTSTYIKNTSKSQKIYDFSNFVGSPKTWEGIGTAYIAGKSFELGRSGALGEAAVGVGRSTKSGVTAYETAFEGGKHSGFLKNYIGRNADEINKAIKSMQTGKQGINAHLDKIANPSKYVADWNGLRPGHQQNLLNGWQNTVTKHTEQIQILKTILGN